MVHQPRSRDPLVYVVEGVRTPLEGRHWQTTDLPYYDGPELTIPVSSWQLRSTLTSQRRKTYPHHPITVPGSLHLYVRDNQGSRLTLCRHLVKTFTSVRYRRTQDPSTHLSRTRGRDLIMSVHLRSDNEYDPSPGHFCHSERTSIIKSIGATVTPREDQPVKLERTGPRQWEQ